MLWLSDFNNIRRIDYGGSVPLFDYQEQAVTAMINAESGILQSPAGSGKTQMALGIISRLKCRTLWLCHTLDLVRQSKERAEMYFDKSLMGTITGGTVNIGRGITFATVQTMCRLDLPQYRNTWDCVIVDECHRVAGSPTTITQYSKILNNLACRHKYGLSATVHRSDGLISTTYALLGDVAHEVSDEAVKDKIMQVGIKPINTKVQLDRCCLNTDGTLNYTKLIGYLSADRERNKLIAHKIERGRPSLILSDRLYQLEEIFTLLPADMQQEVELISGRMTSKNEKIKREQAIENMRNGNKKYLFATYALAKEGLDIPCLERLYMASPQKDYAVITQSIGRIARTAKGKDEPICYDFVDDIGYCVKAYKKRCSTYSKNNCYLIGGTL